MEGQEIWRPVVGYEGHYEVSNRGRVRSLDRYLERKGRHGGRHTYLQRGCVLQPQLINSGYLAVHLHLNGTRSIALVHRLVAEAFHGPARGREADHRDYDRLNNAADNLRWLTPAQNNAHSLPNRLTTTAVRVRAESAHGEVLEFPSQMAAEIALRGKATGVISWALKNGGSALGYTWSRV